GGAGGGGRVSGLDRKLGRELRGAWARLLAIASIIAAGVAVQVALRSAYTNLRDSQERYYSDCRMADFSIELKKAPVADLACLEQIPGVAEIRPRLQFSVTVDLDRVPGPLNS